MRLRRLVLIGLVPIALLAGCSSSSSSGKSAVGTGAPGDSTKAARTVQVQIAGNAYKPPTIDVAKGETVTFNVNNTDATVHEFMIGDSAAQNAYQKTMAAMGSGPMKMPDLPNLIEVEPGQSKAMTWTFPDGTTTMIYGSHQTDDYTKGLKGTINVK